MFKILKTSDYLNWFEQQLFKIKAQIDSRILRLALNEHFGHIRKLSEHLYELKFNNGIRIYYTEIKQDELTIILLLGGNKNGQAKDIRKAQKIAEKIHSN